MKFSYSAIVATLALARAQNDESTLVQEMKDLHPLWLRERCSGLTATTENLAGLKIVDIKADKTRGGFVTKFSDKIECFYPEELIAHELLDNETSFAPTHEWGTPDLFLWDSKLVSPVMYDQDEITDMSDNTRKFASNLLSTGIALIKNVPTRDGECARFGSTFSSLRETESGKVFNITTALQEDTPQRVGTHVENAFRSDAPPDFQMIHALEHCEGSDCQSYHSFVDGFAVAAAICEQDRPAFDMLSKTSLRWESNTGDENSYLYRYAPIFEVEGKQGAICPTVKAVNFNSKSGGFAPKMPKAEMEAFYQAKQTFLEMIHSDEYTIKVQLFPGALIIFDNRRVLHSRSQVADDESWMQGCYYNRDGFTHLYAKLKRQCANMTETPFRNLKGAVRADFDRMGVEYDDAVVKKTKDKLIGILEGLKDSYLGQPVSLYEHNIQTASRVYRGGEDDETIFISLFHDVFETLAVKNHGELIAAMLAPWISPENHWMLAHHEVFQGYYYFDDYGIDKNKRDMYINHPVYNQTVSWCEKYDQASFDPDYPSLPLSTFIPAVERVLARPQYWWNPAHPKAGAVSSASEFEDFALGKPISECPDTWQCYQM